MLSIKLKIIWFHTYIFIYIFIKVGGNIKISIRDRSLLQNQTGHNMLKSTMENRHKKSTTAMVKLKEKVVTYFYYLFLINYIFGYGMVMEWYLHYRFFLLIYIFVCLQNSYFSSFNLLFLKTIIWGLIIFFWRWEIFIYILYKYF